MALFQKEAEYWNISGSLSSPKLSEIHVSGFSSPELILGGPNIVKSGGQDSSIVFQRVYTGLPPHFVVTVIGKFWYFGDFSDEEKWNIFITPESKPRFLLKEVEPEYQKINLAESEVKFDYIKTKRSHQEETLNLIIELKTKSSKPMSVGFRELTIHLIGFTASFDGHKNSYCDQSQGPLLFDSLRCSCQTTGGLSICRDCPENCESCFGIEPSQCSSCSAGSHWNGVQCSPCHWNCQTCTGRTEYECSACNSGFFKYDNGSCLETCHWPSRVHPSDELKCIKHSCKAEQYILDDKKDKNINCVDECPSPLNRFINEDNTKICENPCNLLEFLYWNGSCLACPQPLIQVDGLYGSQCQNPCETTSQYLYANHSCLDNCPAPYQAVSDPGVNFCKHPCWNPQFYVDNNGACHPVCRLPFRVKVENDIKYCLPPCEFDKEFILSDGSCSEECPAPMRTKLKAPVGTYCLSPCESDDYFVAGNNGSCLLSCPAFFDVKMKYGVKHCLQPCLADQYYLEQNKSCLDKCPYLFIQVQSEGVNICRNPCLEPGQDFIYDDQSCQKSCSSPLIRIIEPGGVGRYCQSPCSGGNRYLNADGSCQTKCEYPYKIVEKGPYKICLIDMTSSQIHQIDLMREIIKMSNQISKIGGFLGCLMNAGDPSSIFMIPLLNMLEIVKYTKITLPGEIQLSFEHRLLENSNQQIFDEKIKKIAVLCLVAFLLRGVLKMITPIFSGSKVVQLLQRCSIALQWNILGSVFISFLGDMTLYSLVVFHHSGAKLIFLLLFLPLIVFIMFKIIRVNSQDQEDQQRWRFISEIYKNEKLSQRLFVLIYFLRVVSVSIIIGCLEKHPVIQAILLALITFGMLFYLLCASPIQKKISFIQHLVIEIALVFYNVTLIILSVRPDTNLKNTLGQIMMILSLIAPLITAILIMVKILSNLYSLYKPFGSNIVSSSGFIQLSEIRNDEERNEPSQIISVNEEDDEERNDSEEASIEPPDISV